MIDCCEKKEGNLIDRIIAALVLRVSNVACLIIFTAARKMIQLQTKQITHTKRYKCFNHLLSTNPTHQACIHDSHHYAHSEQDSIALLLSCSSVGRIHLQSNSFA